MRLTDLGEKQHVIDDPVEPGQLFDTGFQHFLVLLDGTLPAQGHLGLAHQVADRRAQLMGEVVRELRELLYAAIQPVEHDIHRMGQFLQLQGQVIQWQAQGQLLGRNLPGDLAEPAQWRQAALYQLPGAKTDQQHQQRQCQQRRAQVGLQQAVVVGKVDREQHANIGAVLQTHQPRGGQQVIVIAVAPLLKGQLGATGNLQQGLGFESRPEGQQG
ncbi:hypothetical protein D3C84_649660 [compost metagenome]